MSSHAPEEMVYVASYPGKAGYGAACVDIAAHASDTAKFVADCIRRGATVQRVTLTEARAGLERYFADIPKQGSLL